MSTTCINFKNWTIFHAGSSNATRGIAGFFFAALELGKYAIRISAMLVRGDISHCFTMLKRRNSRQRCSTLRKRRAAVSKICGRKRNGKGGTCCRLLPCDFSRIRLQFRIAFPTIVSTAFFFPPVVIDAHLGARWAIKQLKDLAAVTLRACTTHYPMRQKESMSKKSKVLQAHPQAGSQKAIVGAEKPHSKDHWRIFREDGEIAETIGIGRTERDAWADTAKNISTQSKPTPTVIRSRPWTGTSNRLRVSRLLLFTMFSCKLELP